MLTFLETGHRFTVAAGKAQKLEFGNRLFFTTLAEGMPIEQMERVIEAGGSLFGNAVVFPALSFHAECVVLLPRTASAAIAEARLRDDFSFGFVQGIRTGDVHLEYWGQIPANGRSILHIEMPNLFEVDTDTSIQPWTRAAASRFELRGLPQGGRFHAVRVSSDFTDHPLYTFVHTVQHTLPTNVAVPHFIRSVSFRRDFRTIFCFLEKKTRSFTPISATEWSIHYDHIIRYSQNGAVRTTSTERSHSFPLGGSPSHVSPLDREILAMARAGVPFATPAVLQARLGPGGARTITREHTNPEFDSSFWT